MQVTRGNNAVAMLNAYIASKFSIINTSIVNQLGFHVAEGHNLAFGRFRSSFWLAQKGVSQLYLYCLALHMAD